MRQEDLDTALKNYVNYITHIDKSLIYLNFQNRVQTPKTNYCVITIYDTPVLGTPIEHYTRFSTEIKQHYQASVQVDFYGENALKYAQMMVSVTKTDYSAQYLKDFGIQPLYCDSARDMTNVNGEKQYERRYMVEFQIEFDSSFAVAQDGFERAELNLIKTEL